MAHTCTFCGSPDHTKFYCRLKPRPPIWKSFKRLRKYGKHAYLWNETRRQWIEKYGSEHICHYCGVRLSDNPTLLEQDLGLRKLTLDHVDPRSKAPELRYADSNLVPCCSSCNKKKGSKTHDAFAHTCYTELQRVIVLVN